MAVYIVRRPSIKSGDPRPPTWHVRWKASRYDPIVHLGTFKRESLARIRKQKVEEILAAGGTPNRDLLNGRDRSTVAAAAEAYLESRVDVAENTRESLAASVQEIIHRFGNRAPATITPQEIVAWILELQTKGPSSPRRNGNALRPLKAGTIRLRVFALRHVLDYAAVAPNPARDPRVKIPKRKTQRKTLPTPKTLAVLRDSLPAERQQVLDVLIHGGLRVEEACSLTWEQVDAKRQRLLNVGTKTGEGSERIVEVLGGQPDWLPKRPAGAAPNASVFPETTAAGMRWMLGDRCEALGLPHVTPHALRHLHASTLLDGMHRDHELSVAAMAARMGHSVNTFLGTYSHVLPPDDDEE